MRAFAQSLVRALGTLCSSPHSDTPGPTSLQKVCHPKVKQSLPSAFFIFPANKKRGRVREKERGEGWREIEG